MDVGWVISSLLGLIATLLTVLWRQQARDAQWWRERWLEKADKYERAVDAILEYIKEQRGK